MLRDSCYMSYKTEGKLGVTRDPIQGSEEMLRSDIFVYMMHHPKNT